MVLGGVCLVPLFHLLGRQFVHREIVICPIPVGPPLLRRKRRRRSTAKKALLNNASIPPAVAATAADT
jgi:hypothetical protein